jgi:hypothetical protein
MSFPRSFRKPSLDLRQSPGAADHDPASRRPDSLICELFEIAPAADPAPKSSGASWQPSAGYVLGEPPAGFELVHDAASVTSATSSDGSAPVCLIP